MDKENRYCIVCGGKINPGNITEDKYLKEGNAIGLGWSYICPHCDVWIQMDTYSYDMNKLESIFKRPTNLCDTCVHNFATCDGLAKFLKDHPTIKPITQKEHDLVYECNCYRNVI
jgi:hypothetical protein